MSSTRPEIEDAIAERDREALLAVAQRLGIDNAQWMTRGQLADAIQAGDTRAVRKALGLRRALAATIVTAFAALFAIIGLGVAGLGALTRQKPDPSNVSAYIPSMLETELRTKSNGIVMLQARSGSLEYMQPTDRAKRLARFLNDDAGDYAKALQAASRSEYNAAQRLLQTQNAIRETEPLVLARTRATIAVLAADYEDAAQRWDEALALAPSDPKLLSEAGYTAFASGDFQRSLQLHVQAAEACEHSPEASPISELAAWNNLGLAYQSLGDYANAEAAYCRSLECAAPLGENTTHYTDIENHLAGLYEAQGRYREAQLLFERVYAVREKTMGGEHPELLFRRGQLLHFAGKIGEAVTVYREGCDTLEERHGDDHPALPYHLRRLGELYEVAADYQNAHACYERSRSLTETALGTAHPAYGLALARLGGVYRAMGRYGEALPMLEQAVSITREALGESHPDYACDLNELAALRERMGALGDAESYYRRSLDATRANLGEKHPQYTYTLASLAGILRSQARFAEAEALHLEALEIDRATIGAHHFEHAIRVKSLASLYHSMGRHDAAEERVREALSIATEGLGEEHPDSIAILTDLGRVLTTAGDYVEAGDVFDRVLEVTSRTLGKAHLNYAVYLNNAGLLAETIGDYSNAAEHFRTALAVVDGSLGKRHTAYAKVLVNLGRVLTAAGALEEAEPAFRSALAIDEAALEANHPLVAFHLVNFASWQRAAGDPDGAIASCARALAIAEAGLGEDHLDVSVVLEDYAKSLRAAGTSTQMADELDSRAAAILAAYSPAQPFARYGIISPLLVGR